MRTTYSHDILSSPYGMLIVHNRVTQRASQLLTTTRLGATGMLQADPFATHTSVHTFSEFLAKVTSTIRQDSNSSCGHGDKAGTNIIDCTSLPEFVEAGRSEWQTYARFGKIMVSYAENERNGSFTGYIAVPAELNAINDIASTALGSYQ